MTGGTTTPWAGQCLPLFDADFAARDWVPHSGWPIARRTLDPYYRRAESVMQVPAATYDPPGWRRATVPVLPDDAGLRVAFSQFAFEPNFWVKYRDDLRAAGTVRLVTRAHVIALAATPGADAVRAVHCRGPDGGAFAVAARAVVVCCGGIESARLLLASDSVEPAGIGNRYDVVGRYFQDHPGVTFPVRVLDRRRFARWYDAFARDRVKVAVKIVADDRMQARERILHAAGEVFYPIGDDDPIAAAKTVLRAARRPELRPLVPAALRQTVGHPGRVARAAWRYLVTHQPSSVGSGPPRLGCGCEQAPNPLSRVTLSDRRDAYGVRRTRLEWRLTDLETRSIATFARAVQRAWAGQGLAEVDVDAVPMAGRDAGEHGGYLDANHHIGTTRMGTDPRTSVVDADCRVHGYDNLYVASSSVFPTGGFSNPTLTVLALALRLCDRLRTLAGRQPVPDAAGAETSNASRAL